MIKIRLTEEGEAHKGMRDAKTNLAAAGLQSFGIRSGSSHHTREGFSLQHGLDEGSGHL